MNFEQILNEQQSELSWTHAQKKRITELKQQGWEVSSSDEQSRPTITKEGSNYEFTIHEDGTFEAIVNNGE